MRGGAIGSICFLAFLILKTTNGENLITTQNPVIDTNDESLDDKTSTNNTSGNATESQSEDSKAVDASTDPQDDQALESDVKESLENPQMFFFSLRSGAPDLSELKSDENLTASDEETGVEDKSGFSFASASGGGSSIASSFPGNSFAQATSQGDAEAFAQNSGNMPSYGSLYPGFGSNSAQAFANAISSSDPKPFQGYLPSMAPSNPYTGFGSHASADALAQTNSGGWSPYGPSYASAQAQSQASSDQWNPFNLGLGYPDSSFASASAQAQAGSGGWSPYGPRYAGEAQSISTALYRPEHVRHISKQEFIVPNSISGQDDIKCSYAGEMYTILTIDNKCLICACQYVLNQLKPVCLGCDSCAGPPLLPIPVPEPILIPEITIPPLDTQVSCSPLPENTPFQNPLNQCQLCVCEPVFNPTGQTDIHIECQEIPQCGAPDIIPIPPIPVPPRPVPMPLCENFPPNVPFPHPYETCKVCKCVVELLSFGIPEPHIICFENPECEELPPYPEPISPWEPPEPIEPSLIPQSEPGWPIPPLPQPESEWPIPSIPQPEPEWPIPSIPQLEPNWPIPPIPQTELEWPTPPIPQPEPILIPQPIPAEPIPSPPLISIPESITIPKPEPFQPIPEIIPEQWLIPEPEKVPEPISESWPIPPPEPWQPLPETIPMPEYIPPVVMPETVPIPEYIPIPETVPTVPIPEPIPIPEPVPVPEPGTELLPWPPISPDLPMSPLPGPPPHRSCRPFPPNKPFQHPWDECRVCVCSEFHDVDVINIEVNCFTKPTCCLEQPFPELPPASYPLLPSAPQPIPEPIEYLEFTPGPHPLPPAPEPSPIIPSYEYLDQSCQYQDIGSEFISPEDICKVCTCELFGAYVAPVCRRSSRPECAVSPAPAPYDNLVYIEPKCRYRMPNQPFVVDCNVCSCQAVFNYVIARCTPQPNCEPAPILPSIGISSNAEASATAFAQAESHALANTASSEAVAIADAIANLNPSQPPSQFHEGLGDINQYQYGSGYPGTSSATADALASSQSNLLNIPVTNYPYDSALAQASSQASYSPAVTGQNPYSVSGSYSSAEALANSQAASLYPGVYGGYPYYTGGSGVSHVQTQSNAIPASQLYPSLYPYPVTQMTGLYQPGINRWESGTLGQLGGGASAQSLAQTAAISGRPLIRSGPGLCKYNGDKYHHNCQACFCFVDRNGSLFSLCMGNPCA